VTEKNIAGTYSLNGFPKTTVTINSDKTFQFEKINPNPYLHPFDHPDQYYSVTKGRWETKDSKTIVLTSQSDTMVYPLVAIHARSPRDKDLSYFTFYDTYGDTVKILYVQYTDSSIVVALHRSIEYAMEDLRSRDTLEFHFYGYRPYTFISGKKINQDYDITLKPSFQPNFFNGTEFRVKRNRLIDIQRNGKFKKTKGGM
jgi:hypothetical protein